MAEVSEYIGRGQSPKYTDEASTVFAINQKCVRNGRVTIENVRRHSAATRVKPESILKDGDVCINSTGTGTIGRVGLWSNQNNDASIYFVDTHVTIVRPKKDVIDSKFLTEILNYPDFQAGLARTCFTGSTNQVELSKSALNKFIISIPPLSAQRQIAEILSLIDENIEKCQSLSGSTKKASTRLLNVMIQGGIGHDDFREVDYGRIPVKWKLTQVKEVAELLNGFAFKSSEFSREGIQVLRMGNLYENRLSLARNPVYLPKIKSNEYAKFLIKPGDIVLTLTGTKGKEDYGYAVRVPNNAPELLLNQRVAKIIPKQEIDARFLLYYLHSRVFLKQIYAKAGGTKQANISTSDILESPFPLPALDEQIRIASILDSMEKVEVTLENELEGLKRLKSALLHDLVTGKVRVNIPNTETSTEVIQHGSRPGVQISRETSTARARKARIPVS